MNMSDAITLNYYNSNAAVFSETTKNVDFRKYSKYLQSISLLMLLFWILVVDLDVIQSIF